MNESDRVTGNKTKEVVLNALREKRKRTLLTHEASVPSPEQLNKRR